jgi:hypothetical protein
MEADGSTDPLADEAEFDGFSDGADPELLTPAEGEPLAETTEVSDGPLLAGKPLPPWP